MLQLFLETLLEASQLVSFSLNNFDPFHYGKRSCSGKQLPPSRWTSLEKTHVRLKPIACLYLNQKSPQCVTAIKTLTRAAVALAHKISSAKGEDRWFQNKRPALWLPVEKKAGVVWRLTSRSFSYFSWKNYTLGNLVSYGMFFISEGLYCFFLLDMNSHIYCGNRGRKTFIVWSLFKVPRLLFTDLLR